MELQLGCIDNCWVIYQKKITIFPNSSLSWTTYADFESFLEEHEWARYIYKTAISWELDQPEKIWKAYIDFETDLKEFDSVRNIYNQLL